MKGYSFGNRPTRGIGIFTDYNFVWELCELLEENSIDYDCRFGDIGASFRVLVADYTAARRLVVRLNCEFNSILNELANRGVEYYDARKVS